MDAKNAMYGFALLTLGMLGYSGFQQAKLQKKYQTEIKAADPQRYIQLADSVNNLPQSEHFKVWKSEYQKIADFSDTLRKAGAAQKAYFDASLKLLK